MSILKLNDNAEILLIRLLIAIDKASLHSISTREWDGVEFESRNLSDYPSPAEVSNSPEILLNRCFEGTTCVIPTAILDEIWSCLAGDANTPGLEDYISGDWREND